MATKYLDSNGLLYLWGKIKSAFVGNVSYNSTTKNLVLTKNGTDSNIVTLITQEDIPEGSLPSTTTPKMDGTATVGSETTFARGDHIHPSDTSRVPTTRTVNGHALSSNVTVTASDIGVESGAQVNVLEGVQMDGTDLTITDKKVNIPTYQYATTSHTGTIGLVPTSNVVSGSTATQFFTSRWGWQELKMAQSTKGNYAVTVGLKYLSSAMGTDYITSADINVASTTTQGLMPASDKAKLDSITMTDGIIDPSVLPSFVDDVIEAYPRSGQTELSQDWLSETSGGSALTPEAGKIYILMADSTSYATNTQFRWSGSAYVKMLDGGVTAITNAEIDVIVAS